MDFLRIPENLAFQHSFEKIKNVFKYILKKISLPLNGISVLIFVFFFNLCVATETKIF